MEPGAVTTFAALFGSLTGAAASIFTTWLTQRTQFARSQMESRLRERQSLYGEFIAEASRLTVEALSHSLEQPETFVKLYGLLGRIRLFAADSVLAAAEACVRRITDLYAKPNLTIDEIRAAFEREHFDPVKEFSRVCRAELVDISGGF
jgi:hypothetical protein